MTRRLPPAVPALVLALLLACGLVAATGAGTQAAPGSATASSSVSSTTSSTAPGRQYRPRADYPTLPRHCATRQEEIPQHPVICHLDTFRSNHPTLVLWGDSHAWMMIPAIRAAAKGSGVNLVAVLMGSCPPMDPQLTDAEREHAADCDKSNDLASHYVARLAQREPRLLVLLGASWQRYVHALRVHDTSDYVGTQAVKMRKQTPRLIKRLAAADITTVVDGQVATVPDRHRDCAKGNLPYSCDLPRHAALPEYQRTLNWLHSVMQPLPGKPRTLDVNDAICAHRVCQGLQGRTHTWFDDLHLSATKSRSLSDHFAPLVSYLTTTDAAAAPEPAAPSTGCVLELLGLC